VDVTVTGRRSLVEIAYAPPLVIWAENPAPFYFNRDPAFRSTMENLARSTHAYVIVNTVIFAGEYYTQPKNSAVVLDPEGRELLQYDKIHLVPFGEYIPWWAFPGRIGKITSQVAGYVPGSTYQVADTGQGKIGVFICYEAIFPQLVRRLAVAGAGVLVNISNDAWYGDSSAAFQHLEMARWRAVENGRYLLRATNDGITVIIDPYGRVVDRIPRHERRVLAGRFNYLARRTFYTAYGDVFAWLCVAVTAAMVAQSFRVRSTDD
jgi:apolipoprotein N-acyltransferase